ncbi:RNA exonuclease [Hirsutella rhossiliensis]|uniref:RNA exonuclease n=1 Tax=Hirsutella rhossiliensis TaxID=111463 RepID=A0A9P8SEG1_9HYPO|nr:RNA exonuclease [Hirsutella rhossiliensis]KAH0957996.1 RNA exonuclease [Hirsutella rhossiliensis]
MDTQYGPIPSSPAHLQRLRELVPSAEELEKAGYVLAQLSASDMGRKRRCDRCTRALKHSGRDTQHGPRAAVTASASSLPSTAPQIPSHARIVAAQEAARISKEFDDAFDELTISLANKPAKPVEPIIRCKFHPGKVAYKKWTCCGNHVMAKPCTGEEHHLPRHYRVGELEKNWRYYPTPLVALSSPPAAAVVIDCEMGTAATGESELIRVSVIDYFSRRVLFDSLVLPQVKMAHYNTRYSGISRQMMEDAHRRRKCLVGRDQARSAVWRLVGPDTIVIGHAGQQDLTSLRWIHPLIVDTLMIEKMRRETERQAEEAAKAESAGKDSAQNQDGGGGGVDDADGNDQGNEDDSASKREGGLSLKALASQRLNRTIQIRGRGHDSVEDALATRDLLCWQISHPMLESVPLTMPA